MKRKNMVWKISVLTLIVIFLSTSYVAYAFNDKPKQATLEKSDMEYEGIKSSSSKELPLSGKAQGIKNTQEIEFPKRTEKEVDISKIEVSTDLSDKIKKSDNKNYNKNLTNYKRALIQMDIPDEFRSKVDKHIQNGRKVPNILALYSFLYDNYGTMDELAELLNNLESGKELIYIIKTYNDNRPEYVPTKFDESYLENLMKSMSIDDIIIADRISQKGLTQFDDLIAQRQLGLSWKEINTELGVINTSDQLPHMSLTHAQVNQCMKDTKLDERNATDVLIMTWETGKDYLAVKTALNNGKKIEDIYAEAYIEKYN